MFTSQNKISNHSYYMSLALQQAQKNLGNTKNNPSVGCVIVKNNCVISAASTGINGTPHAESKAINLSKTDVKKSNLYVTLEPCSHFGKTPPCVNKIIKNKIKNVFFSIYDPDFRSYKKCSRLLKKYGINVNTGINSKKIRNFYKSYFLFKEKKLPFVTLKLAVSKDLKTINRKKKWITNIYSRSRVHLMRLAHDCLVTSSNTIIKDNPLLNCRIKGLESESPTRIILDKDLSIPIYSKIINDKHKNKTIIFYNKLNHKKIKFLKKKKVRLIKSSLNSKNNLNLIEVLTKIKNLGFSRVFLECGEVLATSFLETNLVNDFKLFISSDRLKKKGAGSIRKYYKTFLKNKKFTVEKVNLLGDKLISYKIK